MNTLIRLTLAFLAILAASVTSMGQGVETVTLPVSVVTAGSTSNINVTLDTRKMENVAVALVFNQTVATNVVPLSIVFDKSVDGSNWSAADTVTWSYTRAANTNSTVATTNISVGGYPYIRLKTIAAPGSASDVNLESFKYFVKFMATK